MSDTIKRASPIADKAFPIVQNSQSKSSLGNPLYH